MEIDIWVRTSSMSTKMTDRGYATTHLPACGMIQPIAVPKWVWVKIRYPKIMDG